tara:strand:+ start:3167 stop:3442 length:276 start_codon:yes stop_codon:yes gene_type:complete
MKITFKEVKPDCRNEIYVNEKLVGHVEVATIDGKWKLEAYFSTNFSDNDDINKKFDSSYKAGKTLVKIYERSYFFFESYGDKETQEIDMRV